MVAGLVNTRDYSGEEFLRADGAAERWVEVRKRAIDRLAGFFETRSPKSIAWGNEIRESFSDLRFTDANRVPFPFVQTTREKFNLCTVVTASDGPKLRDLDGNWTLDVSGSYGLNVAGFDRYKDWIQKDHGSANHRKNDQIAKAAREWQPHFLRRSGWRFWRAPHR
jgi:glutamate-1-semialdehyde 2,1-aminomutase